ncbi:two component transcriptional regulator, LuxR family [Plantibacter sp. VKM Ac-1784]|uniref:Two component transcriptional regulator, LuxR family n=1 Tax=Plantibacter elymi (nom. nud.) TaxID=199708 RepID=A0ABY1R9M1_9MICO|nr:response regulator transcription factor [Plantibacter sp. VKM Ac-1784]SMQ64057.1 two component transcriptional regulator, LuxR family [Plantibacter sp. VKM Ac-1784]
MTEQPTRILLVDDQELLRAGFRIILGSQPGIEIVGEASDGAEAVALATTLAPDVICMDVQMPGMDGLEATRRIVADPEVHAAVLILTTFDRDDYLAEALRAGASGFLLKNSSPEELVAAVSVIAGGEALLSPAVTRRVIEGFTRQAPAVEDTVEDHTVPAGPTTGAEYGQLTEREREVLQLVAQGLSNQEIATTLFVGEATVKSHVSKVLQKLALRDRIQAVIYTYEHGLASPRS